MYLRLGLFLFLISLTSACVGPHPPCNPTLKLNNTIDKNQVLADLKYLSSDELAGRKPGTKGSLLAQDYIISRFQQANLLAFEQDFRSKFKYKNSQYNLGTNIIGYKQGNEKKDEYIVVTAHYDHIGIKGRKVFNGADDNASGVSAMLAIVDFLKDKQTQHSIIFVATDAEESGLYGAKAFVKNPPVPIESVKLNLNFDMIGRGGADRLLYVAGTRRNPHLKPVVRKVQSQTTVCLHVGHESRKRLRASPLRQLDWRKASDHAEFDRLRIPYLYFGVDLHRHYHKPTDTFKNIDKPFFLAATETIVSTFKLLDESLENIEK